LAIEPRTEGATFRWPDLSTNRVCAVGGTNFVYTLEAKTTLAQTNWWAVAGAAWPLKTNGWTMTGPQASPAFYRTRADLAPP
jgi:phage-related protein